MLSVAGCGGGESFVVAESDSSVADVGEDSFDSSPVDSSTPTDTGKVVNDPCTGKPNGSTCSSFAGFLCVAESCVPTSCGDGFVDKTAGEECEDGNDINGDGCDK